MIMSKERKNYLGKRKKSLNPNIAVSNKRARNENDNLTKRTNLQSPPDIRQHFKSTKPKYSDSKKTQIEARPGADKSSEPIKTGHGARLSEDLTNDKIVEHFCKLTEEQRKSCFRQMLQVNNLLNKEHDEYEHLLNSKLKAIGYLEGEKEALENDNIIRFSFYPERVYTAGCARQMHFRLAESQFHRTYSEEDEDDFSVTEVEYIVNPELVRRFHEAQNRIKATRGEKYSGPVLAFHGTKEESINSIVETGFRVPGELGFQEANDSGWYGRGIYLSEFPSYAREYMRRGGVSNKLLLCQVLVGKAFHCKERIDGEGLKEGFDSHLSPEKHQIIVFDSDHVLPSYIIHFEKCNIDYKYNN